MSSQDGGGSQFGFHSQMGRVLLAQLSLSYPFGERREVGVGLAHMDEPPIRTVWLRELFTNCGTPRLRQGP